VPSQAEGEGDVLVGRRVSFLLGEGGRNDAPVDAGARRGWWSLRSLLYTSALYDPGRERTNSAEKNSPKPRAIGA
jgi:hypothetical protein